MANAMTEGQSLPQSASLTAPSSEGALYFLTYYLVNFSFSMIASSWRRICAFSSPSSMWS